MANRIFLVGLDTVDDVLAIREQALAVLRAGGSTITSWSSENTSVTKAQGFSLTRILEETLWFLQEYDPGLYGRRVTRTSPAFML